MLEIVFECFKKNARLFFCRKNQERKVFRKSEKPYVNNEDGTYLTLDVLAAILEELSESGKGFHLRPHLS